MTTTHAPMVDAVAPTDGIAPSYPLGFVDAELHDLQRQVSTLSTIEEVRALRKKAAEDWLAGRIDEDEHHRTRSVASLASHRLSQSVVIEGCPAWCNAHNFSYGDQAEADVNLHHHIVEGEGWKVEPRGGLFRHRRNRAAHRCVRGRDPAQHGPRLRDGTACGL